MADPITIKNLPIITEINTGDMLIVQTSSKTGILKFEDFIVGEEHVSFFKDLQDLATDVALLSGDVAPYIDRLQKIDDIEDKNAANTARSAAMEATVNTLNNNSTKTETKFNTLSGELTQTILDLQTNVAVNQANISTLTSNIATISAAVTTLQTDVSTLQTDVSTLQTDVSTLQGQAHDETHTHE
jgi:chromosome segregation ATPase